MKPSVTDGCVDVGIECQRPGVNKTRILFLKLFAIPVQRNDTGILSHSFGGEENMRSCSRLAARRDVKIWNDRPGFSPEFRENYSHPQRLVSTLVRTRRLVPSPEIRSFVSLPPADLWSASINDANLVKSRKANTGATLLTDEQINKNELGLDNGVTLNIRVLTSPTQFPIS